MDGPTAAREIRALGCRYLIVGITGNVLPEDVAQFVENGADAVLPKPLNITDLENTFKSCPKGPATELPAEVCWRRDEYIQKFLPQSPRAIISSLGASNFSRSAIMESSKSKSSELDCMAMEADHATATGELVNASVSKGSPAATSKRWASGQIVPYAAVAREGELEPEGSTAEAKLEAGQLQS